MRRQTVDAEWRGKYPNLVAFYRHNYPSEYYTFARQELEVDPMETKEQIEKYDQKRRAIEMIRCAQSFPYFCHKFVKITHPTEGLLPFILYNYQRRVIKDYNEHRMNIIRKFRQGGLTTITVIWALWRCLFQENETLMVISKTDREAIAAGEIVKRALEELPSWLQPEMAKNNDHQKIFMDTGSKLFFYTPEAARGRAMSFLILDEAAFIPNMTKFWNDTYPTIMTGGNVIAVSTVNGVGNWYEEMYHGAERGDNNFHIIDLNFWEHPYYNQEGWEEETRAELGEKGFQQEVLGDFLGAGDGFLPPAIISDLENQTRSIDPLRVLFQEWVNKPGRINTKSPQDPGALQVWQEPVDGKEYIIGVDVSDAIGHGHDNSCLEVIDVSSCEQVAEFYSTTCPNHFFSQVVASVGIMYNHALVVVEDEANGKTVLNRLQFTHAYDNIYYTMQGKSEKIGIKTTKSSRPMFLEALRSRLLTKSMAIRSKRLVHELKHLIKNPLTKKIEAAKGYHDDATIAMCLAVFVRDSLNQYNPIIPTADGQAMPEEMTERYKAQVYEQIKAELHKGAPEDWYLDDSDPWSVIEEDDDDSPIPVEFRPKRPFDGLLREFGM